MFYYIAMHKAGRSYLLAGPYAEESSAIAAKDKARDLACEKDEYNWFNTFSLGKSEASHDTTFGAI